MYPEFSLRNQTVQTHSAPRCLNTHFICSLAFILITWREVWENRLGKNWNPKFRSHPWLRWSSSLACVSDQPKSLCHTSYRLLCVFIFTCSKASNQKLAPPPPIPLKAICPKPWSLTFTGECTLKEAFRVLLITFKNVLGFFCHSLAISTMNDYNIWSFLWIHITLEEECGKQSFHFGHF